MRNTLILALVVFLATGCGPGNDGDASTREPIPPSASDTGSLSGAYGDTALKLDPSTGTGSSSGGNGNGSTMQQDSSRKN